MFGAQLQYLKACDQLWDLQVNILTIYCWLGMIFNFLNFSRKYLCLNAGEFLKDKVVLNIKTALEIFLSY